jgi:hypothetical protein
VPTLQKQKARQPTGFFNVDGDSLRQRIDNKCRHLRFIARAIEEFIGSTVGWALRAHAVVLVRGYNASRSRQRLKWT